MTVIAWDGKTLAADKLACYGNTRATVTKIQRIYGMLVGGAGASCYVQEVIAWVRDGRDPSAFPSAQRAENTMSPVIVIEADRSVSIYENTPYPVRREDRFLAIGSGRDFAIAAMHLGKTAAEAVAVASRFDSGCGNGIDTLELP